ncbi:helix-turn-helix transcriptional regulator [Streptomyces sp. NBC_00572]|uniref:helix-turn-helix domain-containing protein n=1 Tax=Streptomyces sp. NBC_00572 TaxID=2903664 RepID=UPI0022530A91|nr:helix-turn-helix transcriptional regulator [Streptomyces sp. NBC_00572]MCX4982525.1 helix-turn-helix transcriptional regulator [Streptomyces sp. NBC_00572]
MPGAKELDPGDSIEQYLGSMVREARLALGREWTQTYVAAKVFSSGSRISEIERGEDPPDRDLARKLERALQLPRDSLVNLVQILNQLSVRSYAKVLSRQNVRNYAKTYMRRQLEATAIHEFSIVVPGLLQTGAYARGAMEAGLAGDAAQIDGYVRTRLDRQVVLDRADPPWMVIVLDEACLRREIGGRQVMREQVEHLLAMSERPHVNIQLLPASSASVSGSFALLTLPQGERGAYTEGFVTGNYTEEPTDVMRFQRVHDLLLQVALGIRASRELMHAIAKEHAA